MLAGPDSLVGLHMPVERTQDEPLHNFPQYRECSAFLDPFALQVCLPRDSLNQCPEQAKVCPPEVHGSGFAHPPPYFATNRELCHIMVTRPKTASNHHISHQSFSVNSRSSEAPPLVGSLTSCVRKLSSTHSRNLLDCFLSAVLYFQQTSEAVVIRGAGWLTLGNSLDGPSPTSSFAWPSSSRAPYLLYKGNWEGPLLLLGGKRVGDPLLLVEPPSAALASGMVGKGTLLAHVQLGVHQDPQVQVQDFALPLVELHEVPVSPFLQSVQVPLDGSTTLWHISHSSQICVISKLAEGTLCLIIQIINEDVEHDRTQYWGQYWGTPLVTGLQLDFMPLITTLWAWPFS
ncbi:hypothetical protein QYF61_008805 [Mycteria americana]|uniref:Uncharacterized protein n=1 Tax=Mycteria americana TaxID=33587 RepID=A0AAN7NHG6_MYCAM|nr:hypothetical protein QYF61_008805 [Mycteria americana]